MAIEQSLSTSIGYLVGTLSRALYFYLTRLQKEPDLAYDRRFWVSLASAMGISLILGLATLISVIPILENSPPILLFLYRFSVGFTVAKVFENRDISP